MTGHTVSAPKWLGGESPVAQLYALMVGEVCGPDDVTHQVFVRKRGHAMSDEHMPPTGQAAVWYGDVICYVPPSGQHVARQIARLCGADSLVTLPWRSLADAVGITDKAGRLMAYTQRGVQVLVDSGWLKVETTGSKRGARTTFYLMTGDPYDYSCVSMVEADNVDEVA
jgi:hypothetical protein